MREYFLRNIYKYLLIFLSLFIILNLTGCGNSGGNTNNNTNNIKIPAIPTKLYATTYYSSMKLSWSAVPEANYYEIYHKVTDTFNNPRELITSPLIAEGENYAYTFPKPATAQYYWLKACNSVGCSDFSSSFSINDGYGTLIVSNLISVYDGDTFKVDINSFPAIAGRNISIRVKGLDTPEIKGSCQEEKDLAIEVRDFVENKLSNANIIKLINTDRGKYFRILANVLYDGISLEEELIKHDPTYAYKYNGGTKQSWCF